VAAVVARATHRVQLRQQRREIGHGRADQRPEAIRWCLAGEAPKRLDQRQVWQPLAAQVETRPVEHGTPPAAGTGHGFADEAALADPGLAADEQQDGPTACSRVECPLDSPELLVAANDDRARTRRHAADGTAAGLRLSAERGSGALRDQRRTTPEG